MFNYNKNVEFDIIIPNLKASNLKQIIQSLSTLAAPHCHTRQDIFIELLTEQEKRSNSAQGEQTAVFHLQLKGPDKPLYVLATLNNELDLGASDGQNVDLIALVISPLKDGPLHLRRLSRLSRMLMNKTLHDRLVEAKNETDIRAILIDPEGWMLAA